MLSRTPEQIVADIVDRWEDDHPAAPAIPPSFIALVEETIWALRCAGKLDAELAEYQRLKAKFCPNQNT